MGKTGVAVFYPALQDNSGPGDKVSHRVQQSTLSQAVESSSPQLGGQRFVSFLENTSRAAPPESKPQ